MSIRRVLVLSLMSTTLLAPGLSAVSPHAAAAAEPTPIRANARWYSVADSQGTVWGPRSDFGGSVKRTDRLEGQDVAGTTEDVLYRSSLFGPMTYRTAVSDGRYRVRLLMAEGYFTEPGRRVFDVVAEGSKVLDDVDIVAAVGPAHAYDREFEVDVADGELSLDFVGEVDNPLVAAIEITPAPPAPPAPPAVAPPEKTSEPRPEPEAAPTEETVLPAMQLGTDVDGKGVAPVIASGDITAAAGPGWSRSEVWWGDDEGGRLRLSAGTTVTAEFDVKTALTDPKTGALPPAKTWHTIFQLHGPTLSRTWPTPPLALSWENGTFRLGGGAGVPDSTGKMSYQGSWYPRYLPAPDGQWRHFKVTAHLDGPGRGWVSVWVDGELWIDRWMPRAGTMYTDSGAYSHKEINVKSGLYTGSLSPDWNRHVQQRDLEITWRAPGTDSRSASLR